MNEETFTILVGVDYSELGKLALEEGARLGKLRAPSHIHVVHAIQYTPRMAREILSLEPDDTEESEDERSSDKLRDYVRQALGFRTPRGEERDESSEPARLTTHVRRADPAEAIAQLATDIEADLVVVGTHGRRGVTRLQLGSVAEGVVRLAPCAVLVVRPRGVSAGAEVPRIEPPCPRCLETRRATNGQEFWCAQHREHHQRRHTYHFARPETGTQSGLLLNKP